MQPLHIEVTRGQGDCEDCGVFDTAHFVATFGDGTSLEGSYDEHTSDGNWGGTMEAVYLWCLEKLGFVVHSNGAPLMRWPFLKYDPAVQDYRPVALFEGEPTVLSLTVSYAANPDCEFPGVVTWPSGSAGPMQQRRTPQERRGASDWEGGWTQVYRTLLEDHVQLTVVEVDHSDDD